MPGLNTQVPKKLLAGRTLTVQPDSRFVNNFYDKNKSKDLPVQP